MFGSKKTKKAKKTKKPASTKEESGITHGFLQYLPHNTAPEKIVFSHKIVYKSGEGPTSPPETTKSRKTVLYNSTGGIPISREADSLSPSHSSPSHSRHDSPTSSYMQLYEKEKELQRKERELELHLERESFASMAHVGSPLSPDQVRRATKAFSKSLDGTRRGGSVNLPEIPISPPNFRLRSNNTSPQASPRDHPEKGLFSNTSTSPVPEHRLSASVSERPQLEHRLSGSLLERPQLEHRLSGSLLERPPPEHRLSGSFLERPVMDHREPRTPNFSERSSGNFSDRQFSSEKWPPDPPAHLTTKIHLPRILEESHISSSDHRRPARARNLSTSSGPMPQKHRSSSFHTQRGTGATFSTEPPPVINLPDVMDENLDDLEKELSKIRQSTDIIHQSVRLIEEARRQACGSPDPIQMLGGGSLLQENFDFPNFVSRTFVQKSDYYRETKTPVRPVTPMRPVTPLLPQSRPSSRNPLLPQPDNNSHFPISPNSAFQSVQLSDQQYQ